MDYMTIKEASADWGIGTRIITVYCAEGRICGARKRGNLWLIPKNTAKPDDRRRKKIPPGDKAGSAACGNAGNINEKIAHVDTDPYRSLYEDGGIFAGIVKNLPYPMHVCAPDGKMLFANEAFLKFAKISNPGKLYGKHNILNNPSLERWGVKDFTTRAFRGESVFAYDVRVPLQEIIELLGDDREFVCGSMFQDMSAFPIRGGDGRLLYIVFVFITSRCYLDKKEIAKGKEYIDENWRDRFDMDKLARTVHISRHHYSRLFKHHTGMTPYQYYQKVKIEKIKERLCEKDLTVTEAFAGCGVDYNGGFIKTFKQKTGMTPSEYRAMTVRK